MPRASDRSSWRTSSIWRPTDASARSPRSEVLPDRLRCHVELDPQPHEVLLDPVVEVALEPPAFGVGHLHQPDPRRGQVGRRRLEFRLGLGLLEPDQRGRAGGLHERLIA